MKGLGWVPALLVVLLGAYPLCASATSRGITVAIRSSEAPDAPVAETVQLYSASHALIIGIDDYTNGWPKLSNAVTDAEDVAKELKSKGFDVEFHKNVKAAELGNIFKKFFIIKGDNPSARLFIWFAGHGATVDGEGYLIPADAPVPSKGPVFKLDAVALRDFGTYMRQAVSKHVYAVFDSCFAGTVFSSQRALPPPAITRATTMPVREFLTSGDADQTVSDDGTFRTLFIRALNGEERADANGDGYLTASELGMFMGDRITNLTQSQQTPRYGKLRDKNFDRGDFVFKLPQGSVATPLPTATPTLPVKNNSAEIAFWDSIKDSDSASEFAAYLKQYPKGSFAQLAMIKKTQIEKRLEEAKQQELAHAAFDVESLDEEMKAARLANVRQTPFPTAPRVDQLEEGARVWVVGEAQTDGGTWYKIARDGVELGFVYGPLLASIGATDRLVAVQALPPPTAELPKTEIAATSKQPARADQIADAGTSKDQKLSLMVEDILQQVVPPGSAATASPGAGSSTSAVPNTAQVAATTSAATTSQASPAMLEQATGGVPAETPLASMSTNVSKETGSSMAAAAPLTTAQTLAMAQNQTMERPAGRMRGLPSETTTESDTGSPTASVTSPHAMQSDSATTGQADAGPDTQMATQPASTLQADESGAAASPDANATSANTPSTDVAETIRAQAQGTAAPTTPSANEPSAATENSGATGEPTPSSTPAEADRAPETGANTDDEA
ncbi:MAG TPA: caspase family protein, partial [Pseudomonadales bacterium]|nr:caspase family protein [Pseudomonadales bacterium]